MMFEKTKTKAAIKSGKLKVSLSVACLLLGQSMTSYAETTTYELLVFKDTVQGRLITKGKLDKALAMMTDAQEQSFNRANNHCVMMTMAKSFEKALPSCDSAVESANVSRANARSGSLLQSAAAERSALALSNRGVAKAMSGDSLGAKIDFTQAIELDQTIAAAEANLELLESKMSMTAPIAHAGE